MLELLPQQLLLHRQVGHRHQQRLLLLLVLSSRAYAPCRLASCCFSLQLRLACLTQAEQHACQLVLQAALSLPNGLQRCLQLCKRCRTGRRSSK